MPVEVGALDDDLDLSRFLKEPGVAVWIAEAREGVVPAARWIESGPTLAGLVMEVLTDIDSARRQFVSCCLVSLDRT
jgi:hypothetical protein